MKNRGVTLVELMVVISIIGILAIALGFSYVGWQGKYKIERVTKELYSDLMNARSMAVTRNRAYFADFPSATTYRISVDDSDGTAKVTDGDGTFQPQADPAVVTGDTDTTLPTFPKTMEYTLNENLTGNTITFAKGGLISPNGSIWFTSASDPDYDCIIIDSTRINMGRWNGVSCVAK